MEAFLIKLRNRDQTSNDRTSKDRTLKDWTSKDRTLKDRTSNDWTSKRTEPRMTEPRMTEPQKGPNLEWPISKRTQPRIGPNLEWPNLEWEWTSKDRTSNEIEPRKWSNKFNLINLLSVGKSVIRNIKNKKYKRERERVRAQKRWWYIISKPPGPGWKICELKYPVLYREDQLNCNRIMS